MADDTQTVEKAHVEAIPEEPGLPGHETQQQEWERQYAEAHARWEAHKAQVDAATKADAEAAAGGSTSTSYSSATGDAPEAEDADRDHGPRASAPAPVEGTLASDEALAALREKLTGN